MYGPGASAPGHHHGLLLRARAEIHIGQLPYPAVMAPHPGAIRPGPEPLEVEAARVASLHVRGEAGIAPVEGRLELEVDVIEALPLGIDEPPRVRAMLP